MELKSVLDLCNLVQILVPLGITVWGIILWFKGILPVLLRLGNGLAKRKIAVFASSNNFTSLENLLLDSTLFNKKNLISITMPGDINKAENETLLLVVWEDYKNQIDSILHIKKDKAALIVYALPGSILPDEMKKLNDKRNVIVTNFRGRLLNDIVTSMITTGCEGSKF